MTIVLAGLLLGMAGSLHCVTMCGPLIMLATGGSPTTGGWPAVARRLGRSAWHHSGRILVYATLGVVAGATGHLLGDAGLRQWVSVIAGVGLTAGAVLSLMGRRLTPGGIRWSGALTHIISRASGTLRRDRAWSRLALGALNGLLPCGLLYGALLAAAGLGRPLAAGAFMVAFGVGSVPALATLAVAMSGGGKSRNLWRRLSPVATAVVGLLLIVRGLGLSGLHAAHVHVMK